MKQDIVSSSYLTYYNSLVYRINKPTVCSAAALKRNRSQSFRLVLDSKVLHSHICSSVHRGSKIEIVSRKLENDYSCSIDSKSADEWLSYRLIKTRSY